jgi:hypothetical protein
MELFENFLRDPKQYDAAENLWQKRWNELVHHLREENVWRAPWLTATFVNGSKMRDANPIFSAICPERRLAVSIIQIEPSKEPSLRLWTETFAKDEPEEVNVLTIVCVLDERTLSDVIDALHQWIRTGTGWGQMPGIRGDSRLWESDQLFPLHRSRIAA